MRISPDDEVRFGLRYGAQGSITDEAGVELLIKAFRGRFAQPGNPWIRRLPDNGWCVDFDSIPENVGTLSAGERSFILIAASIGGGAPVELAYTLCDLD